MRFFLILSYKSVLFIKLYIKSEKNYISVLNNVLFSFHAYDALFSCGCKASVVEKILIVDYLRLDEATLEVSMYLAGCCGAFVPFFIVHARHSSSPAVRKEISPRSE